MNNTLQTDMAVVRRILPAYTVRERSDRANSIRCTSRTGISDATDGPFNAVMAAFRKHFGERLLEVYHDTCTNNVDFTIYLKLDSAPQA